MSAVRKLTNLLRRTSATGSTLSDQEQHVEYPSEAHRLVAALLAEAPQATSRYAWEIKIDQIPSSQPILDAEPAVQVEVIGVAAAELVRREGGRLWSKPEPELRQIWALRDLLSRLFRRKLPHTTDVLTSCARVLVEHDLTWTGDPAIPLGTFVRAIERHAAGPGLSAELQELLHQFASRGRTLATTVDQRGALDVIEEALGVRWSIETDPIDAGDVWGPAAKELLAKPDQDVRGPWLSVLAYAATAIAARPSAKWLKGAQPLITAMGEERFVDQAAAFLGLLDQLPRTTTFREVMNYRFPNPLTVLTERNSNVVRGLAWCAALVDDARMAAAVGDAAIECFVKIPGIGPRSQKVGNSCIWALGEMPGTAGAAQLGRLAQKVKYHQAQQLIEKTMERAAERAGMSRDDLEELTVPGYGLEDGRIRQELGECVAEIAVRTRHFYLRWFAADGKPLRGVPAAVKRAFPDEVEDLKRTASEAEAMLGAQRERMERLFLMDRSWSLADWRSRYLDHPLLAILSRRLIWWFGEGAEVRAGVWLDGQIVDAHDRPLEGLSDETRVRLWHPIAQPLESVLAWRGWLERHEVRQPFKQAHREVYILTDAELNTGTYSNRFAAHILRQHVFSAISRQRGWVYGVQGGFDGGSIAYRDLPRWGLTAEYWIEGMEGRTSDMGIAMFISTDQVRFTRVRYGAPLSLTEVPALVLSEMMRDVDLFVGVCSVGNDPTWRDTGPAGHREYWQSYAFGDLSATAHTRKAVLERLMPRLTIADRCTLTDKFLKVRGELRTYKIHLGSGNILMEPNDQYLCIVPGRKAEEDNPGTTFLPFEGDSILAIIMSKAFLLADDRAIKDPTITSQIGR